MKDFLYKIQVLFYRFFSKTPERTKRFYSYRQMHSVLIIFESAFTERNETIKKAVNSLQMDGKRVAAWGYVDKEDIQSATVPSYRVLGKKDLDIFQRPKKEIRQDLEEQQFDTVIDLTTRQRLPLLWIMHSAHADLRIGRDKENPFYDFVIDIPDDQLPPDEGMGPDAATKIIWTEVEKYLKMID